MDPFDFAAGGVEVVDEFAMGGLGIADDDDLAYPFAFSGPSSLGFARTTSCLSPTKKVAPVEELEGLEERKYRRVLATEIKDDEDDWKVAVSRKYGMRRGVAPDEVTPPSPDKCLDLEFPWGTKFGGVLREIRKWSQIRRSGRFMTPDGPAYITYGSYGPDGFES